LKASIKSNQDDERLYNFFPSSPGKKIIALGKTAELRFQMTITDRLDDRSLINCCNADCVYAATFHKFTGHEN
jgi:hypothetical protein